MTTLPITKVRANLYSLIKQVSDNHEQITITTKNKNAVLVSEDDWSSIQETMYLMSSPINARRLIEAMDEIDEMIKANESNIC